jgi:hypothetical protein
VVFKEQPHKIFKRKFSHKPHTCPLCPLFLDFYPFFFLFEALTDNPAGIIQVSAIGVNDSCIKLAGGIVDINKRFGFLLSLSTGGKYQVSAELTIILCRCVNNIGETERKQCALHGERFSVKKPETFTFSPPPSP